MANSIDLQAVSIDPGKIVNGSEVSAPVIKKGEKVFIRAIMKNNGPDILPKGEAKVMITFDNKILALPTKRNFKSERWSWGGMTRKNRFANLWFINKTHLPVNENNTGFQFDIIGKNYGESKVTLNSSLTSTATSGDVQGFNQAVDCTVKVAKI